MSVRRGACPIMSLLPFDPLASSAPVIVYIDYKSPYAYLAKDPTYAIEDQFGIEIDWRPFTLDIPSYLGSARLDQQGRVVESKRTPDQWIRVKHAYHDVRRYGSLRGLIVRGTTAEKWRRVDNLHCLDRGTLRRLRTPRVQCGKSRRRQSNPFRGVGSGEIQDSGELYLPRRYQHADL